jgi:disulfide bond formation protein DsbB
MTESDQSSNTNWMILFFTWVVVSGATLGSIFFSHVMEYTPCVLCWYQRICLFPLVLIMATGLFPFDKRVVAYSLPLAIVGWLIAFYHNLLYSKIIPQAMQPCTQGVSCTEKYIDLFGFITIPMLSLFGFTIIIALLIILKRRIAKNEI